MEITANKFITFPAVLAVLTVLLFGFSGFGMMGADMSNPMVNCPFAGHSASICKMNPMEHVQEWQSMFTSTFQQNGSALILLLLSALALVRARSLLPILPKKAELQPYVVRRETYLPPPLLQKLFSNGILNTKVF